MPQNGSGRLLFILSKSVHGEHLQTSHSISQGRDHSPHSASILIIWCQDITFNQTRALLDYMYHGQVSVQEEELQGLLKVAEALKVKGLVESEDGGKGAASAKRTKSAPASKSSSSSGGKQPIWPVTTSKLLSPNKMGKSETDDDPGTLVIDEESSEANVTMSPLDTDYDMGYLNEHTPPAPGMVKTIGPNGKVEWKRYKQYTKDDILAAIEEVKNGMPWLLKPLDICI